MSDYAEYKYLVYSTWLEKGATGFRAGARKLAPNLLERINSDGIPWFRFVENRETGWSFDAILTDHRIFKQFVGYPAPVEVTIETTPETLWADVRRLIK